MFFLLVINSLAQTVSKIEYDGVYVEIGPSQYVKLSETKNFRARWRIDYVNQSSWPTIWITNEEKRTDLKEVRKIIFSGFSPNDMYALSIHPATSIGNLYTVLYSDGIPANRYYTYECKNEYRQDYIECRYILTKIRDGYYEVLLSEDIIPEKTYVIWINNKFWFFKSSSATSKKTIEDTKNPTANGAYVKLKSTLYKPLDKSKYSIGTYSEYRKECRCYVNQEGRQLGFYNHDKDYFYEEEIINSHRKSNRVFPKENFDGIVVKGDYYDFNLTNIYKLSDVDLGGEQKKSVVTNRSVKIDQGKVFMLNKSNVIEFQKKTVGDLCTFVPIKPLEVGDYSICIGRDCWLFSIK